MRLDSKHILKLELQIYPATKYTLGRVAQQILCPSFDVGGRKEQQVQQQGFEVLSIKMCYCARA